MNGCKASFLTGNFPSGGSSIHKYSECPMCEMRAIILKAYIILESNHAFYFGILDGSRHKAPVNGMNFRGHPILHHVKICNERNNT